LHPHHSFDAAYVQRLKEGDPETETHFCHYFGDLARIKATARLRSAEPADDIRQETLMRVLRIIRQGGIEHPERLGAFVNAVCGNVILEYLRRNKRLSQFPEEQTDIPSEEASVEVGLLKEERTALVKRALDDLSPKDRELLRRIFLDEHDKDEVCQELKVSREYLRVLLHRARVRLRSALNKGRRSARAD
jgi:RNA polymerase sigma-70 factor (ECF subfamily)